MNEPITQHGSEKRASFLKRTASEVRNYRVRMKMLTMILVLLTTFTGVAYMAASLYDQTGSFSIKVDKWEMKEYGLTLSESKEMTRPTSSLHAKIAEKMTNIAGDTIDKNVDMIDGEHNGRDYIAYTFYVQNAGENELSYEYDVKLSNVTSDLDEAVRLKLYVNGEPTTYAKTRSDGGGAEKDTVEFSSATTVTRGRIDGFKPEDKTKFTVVIWLEGNDPDCTDGLIGGKLKLDMNVSVVH